MVRSLNRAKYTGMEPDRSLKDRSGDFKLVRLAKEFGIEWLSKRIVAFLGLLVFAVVQRNPGGYPESGC